LPISDAYSMLRVVLLGLRACIVAWMMAECESVLLASLVAQVRGIMFYGLQVHEARLAGRVLLVRRPDHPYDLDVRVVCSSYIQGATALSSGDEAIFFGPRGPPALRANVKPAKSYPVTW